MAISPMMSPLVTMNSRIGPNPLTANTSRLNPFASAGLNQHAERLFVRMNEEKAQVTEKYEAQTKALDLDEKRIYAVMRDLAAAKTGIEKALKGEKSGPHGIETIDQSLMEMRSAVSRIEEALKEGESEDVAYYKLKYDNALARLNEAANDYNSPNNLIGAPQSRADWSPNSIEYLPRPTSGRFATINGDFLGADFRIETDSGDVWAPTYNDATTVTDPGKSTYGSGGEITLYTDYNPYNPQSSGGKGESVAFKDLTLVEQTGDRITLNYKDGEETKTVSGTLKKGGLGVGPSFLYSMDAAGLEEMRSGLSSATYKVSAAKANFEAHENTIKRTEKRYSEAIQDIAKERQKIASLRYVDHQEIEQEYRRQYEVMEQNYAIMTQSQQAYVQAFQSTMVSMGKKNPFFDIIG